MHKSKEIDYYLGIDPGKLGAVALIDKYGNCIRLFDLPYLKTLDLNQLNIFLEDFIGDNVFVIIEEPRVVSAKLMKSDGKGFNIGLGQVRTTFLNYGKLIAFFELSGFKIKEISPQAWKNKFNLDSDKKKSIELARKLFPDQIHKLMLSKDGRAEALLIAEYGRKYEI